MKFLIVGLGNIGDEYARTRHNIGFDVVDALVEAQNEKFKTVHWAQMAQINLDGKKLYCLKPTTYMNLSGKAYKYWLQYYDIPPENSLVIVDDLAIDFGKQRLRASGSAGGHNGLKSIDEHLGNNVYARLRIGIGDNFKKGKQIDYVLGKWTAKEMESLPNIIKRAVETVESFVAHGIDKTMNTFNS